jgi:hypothetical protein
MLELSVPWPNIIQDSFSSSGTLGSDTSCTRGWLALPVTETPASTSWLRRMARMLMLGLAIGPWKLMMPRSILSFVPKAS